MYCRLFHIMMQAQQHLSNSRSSASKQINCAKPQGWEQRCDPNTGSFFYIDHNSRQTCWEVGPRKTFASCASASLTLQASMLPP